MGLDCSHDAFSGAYSAFNNLRQCVCRALGEGASFPPHWQYDADGKKVLDDQGMPIFNRELTDGMIYFPDNLKEERPGLWEFLLHSDCDGEIPPAMCTKVADDLEWILPQVEALGWKAGGHILAQGGYVEVVRKFISGCRSAASEGVPLEFY